MQKGTTRELMVEVYSEEGQLSAYWLNKKIPLTSMHGTWRAPIRLFANPLT